MVVSIVRKFFQKDNIFICFSDYNNIEEGQHIRKMCNTTDNVSKNKYEQRSMQLILPHYLDSRSFWQCPFSFHWEGCWLYSHQWINRQFTCVALQSMPKNRVTIIVIVQLTKDLQWELNYYNSYLESWEFTSSTSLELQFINCASFVIILINRHQNSEFCTVTQQEESFCYIHISNGPFTMLHVFCSKA